MSALRPSEKGGRRCDRATTKKQKCMRDLIHLNLLRSSSTNYPTFSVCAGNTGGRDLGAKDAPVTRAVAKAGRIIARPILGGLQGSIAAIPSA